MNISEPERAQLISASDEVTRKPLSESSSLMSPKNGSSAPTGLPVEGSMMPFGFGATSVPEAQSHSSAPFFHSYMKPMVSTARKTIIDQKPNMPISPNETAQGNRKATSRSKMMNRIDTR